MKEAKINIYSSLLTCTTEHISDKRDRLWIPIDKLRQPINQIYLNI